MDANISLRTSADLTGVQAVQKGLMEIRQLAQEISKSGISIAGTVPQTYTESIKQRIQSVQQSAVSGTIGAQAVRSSQPTGIQVGEWMQQNMPIINAMMGSGSSSSSGNSRVPKPQKFAAKPGTVPTPQNISSKYRNGGQGTPDYIKDWFLSVERNLTPGSTAHDEWHSANQSWIQGDRRAPETFYRRFSSEQNMVPVPSNSSANVNPSNSALGQIISSALPSRGLAGTLGRVIGGVGLGGLVAGGLAAGAVGLGVNSFGKFMDSGDALSELTKQIISTKDSLETLQKTVLPTGAAMAMSADMTAKVANYLGTAYGSMSLTTMNNRVSQVGGMGLAYGVSPDVLAQGFAGAAQMGVTTGIGSMSQGQLAFALANSAGVSGMSGRMTDLIQEFLSVIQGTEATNPIANSGSLLSIITSMNANLPRSMTGTAGAAILNQIGSAVANPNGLQQMINYQALSKAGVGGYFDIMKAQEMGPGYTLPNGQTVAESIFNQYNQMFGGNTKGAQSREEYYIQRGLGVSMPQAEQLLKIFGPGGAGLKGIQDNLGISPSQLGGTDWGKIALFGQLNGAQSERDIQSIISQYEKGGGQLTEEQKKALSARAAKGDIGGERSLLAQDILGGKYDSKTTTDKYKSLTATVTNAQITVTGSIASGNNSPPTKQNVDDAIKNAQAFGFGTVQPSGTPGGYGYTPTSYTPGGYNYSPAIIASAMGINGIGSAFAWLSAKGGSSGGGIIQTGLGGQRSGSIPGSFSSTGNKISDFIKNMSPYAQSAAGATGLPTSFILGQWALESDWGTSSLAQGSLNFAGITNNGKGYQSYSSIDDFVKSYDSVINNPRYAGARSAAANGADAKTIGDLLHQEGYAEDKNYGTGIAGTVKTEANELNLSDTTLARLSQAIANAINANGFKNPGYLNT